MSRITGPQDTPSSQDPSLPHNGKTILLGEDDPFISRMYDTKLTLAGYKVIVKNNGRDLYDEIKHNHPDLLLLDLHMPDMTGLELLAALKADNFDFSSMPIIIVTNSTDPDEEKRAKSYNVEYCIKADLTPKQVLDMINQKLAPGNPPA